MSTENTYPVADALSEAAQQSPTWNLVFAATADDPRSRRPADAVSLVVSVPIVLVAGWAYASNTDTDRRILAFFAEGNPSWLSGVFTLVFILGGLYAVGLFLAIDSAKPATFEVLADCSYECSR